LLTGNNLILITEVAATPDMANAVEVPPEFTGSSLTVPNIAHPGNSAGTLYIKLRDDPETVQTLNLPVSLPATAQEATANASAKPDTLTGDPSAELGTKSKTDSKADTAAAPQPNPQANPNR
jgi:hypothetical protein